MDGFHDRPDRDGRDDHLRTPGRVGTGGSPAARLSAGAPDVAGWRAAAGPPLHGRLRRPARLRAQRLPGLHAGPRAVHEARHAADLVAVMERLGFARFSVAGHDRGGRVAYRMAIDHPDRVDRLAALDVLPTETVWERADARFALGFWPWSLLALWRAWGTTSGVARSAPATSSRRKRPSRPPKPSVPSSAP